MNNKYKKGDKVYLVNLKSKETIENKLLVNSHGLLNECKRGLDYDYVDEETWKNMNKKYDIEIVRNVVERNGECVIDEYPIRVVFYFLNNTIEKDDNRDENNNHNDTTVDRSNATKTEENNNFEHILSQDNLFYLYDNNHYDFSLYNTQSIKTALNTQNIRTVKSLLFPKEECIFTAIQTLFLDTNTNINTFLRNYYVFLPNLRVIHPSHNFEDFKMPIIHFFIKPFINAKNELHFGGLSNLGNTCFMNSALQCLVSFTEFTAYFTEKYKNDGYVIKNRNKAIQSKDSENKTCNYIDITSDNRNILTYIKVKAISDEFSFLINKMSKKSIFCPNKFRNAFIQKVKQFNNYEQHDSAEFIETFLDTLHEETKNEVEKDSCKNENSVECEYKEWKKNIIDSQNNLEHTLNDTKTFLLLEYKQKMLNNEYFTKELQTNNVNLLPVLSSFYNFVVRNDSIVTRLFYGQFTSTLKCLDCSFSSFSFDPFIILTLPIPKPKFYHPFVILTLKNKPPFKIYVENNLSVKELKLKIKDEYKISHKIGITSDFKNIKDECNIKSYKKLYCYEYKNNQEYQWMYLKIKTRFGLFEKVFDYGILCEKMNSIEELETKVKWVIDLFSNGNKIEDKNGSIDTGDDTNLYESIDTLNDTIEDSNKPKIVKYDVKAQNNNNCNNNGDNNACDFFENNNVSKLKMIKNKLSKTFISKKRNENEYFCTKNVFKDSKCIRNKDKYKNDNNDVSNDENSRNDNINDTLLISPDSDGKQKSMSDPCNYTINENVNDKTMSQKPSKLYQFENKSWNAIKSIFKKNESQTHVNNLYEIKNIKNVIKKCEDCYISFDEKNFNAIFGNDFCIEKFLSTENNLNAENKFSFVDKLSLQSCLEAFTKKEYLSNVYCKKCNVNTNQTKKMEISILPKYLIMQLKRFCYEKGSGEKLCNFIDFEEYFYLGDVRYKLVSVCNHIDMSFESGHYTAYVKRKEKWLCYNDSVVNEIDRLEKKNAYILFYEMV